MSQDDDMKTLRSPEALEAATTGDTVFVRGRPDYRAVIESDCFGRLTVRPLPDQNMSTRARAIWRDSLIEVEAQAAQPSKQEDWVRKAVDKAMIGDRVLVRSRPDYYANIVSLSFNRLTVRPLPDQGIITRSRVIWRTSMLKAWTSQAQAVTQSIPFVSSLRM